MFIVGCFDIGLMEDTVEIRSTRHELARQQQGEDGVKARLGRRESEPHSDEINYLYDVLSTNFPEDRTFWDLHHYFDLEGDRLDLQFDITYFRGLDIPYRLSSYDAAEYGGRVPTLAVNILSASTFRNDLGIVLEQCQRLQIPVYVVLSDHLQNPSYVRAPMLKIYYREGDQYHIVELHETCGTEGGEIDASKLLDVRPDLLPFKFGIVERKAKYKKHDILPLYYLALVERDTGMVLLTSRERAEREAEDERQKRLEAEKQAEDERQKRLEAEKRAEEAERKLRELTE